MKKKILEYFQDHLGDFISGEKISKELDVSRSAIWKYMQNLRAQGYEFESQSRKSYCLRTLPDRLSPEIVIPKLKTIAFGRTYCYDKQMDTTNRVAKELATQGAVEGTVVVAEEQIGGKGRLQRGWFSPAQKGMWLSIILRPTFSPADAPKVTFLSAVAMAKVLRRYDIDAGIKWPNDILVNNKKIVGILTELSAEVDQIHYVVTGIGLNINIDSADFPEELQEIATSMKICTGKTWDRSEIVSEFLVELEKMYNHILENGFDELFVEWSELNVTLGEEVLVVSGDSSYEGRAIELDPSGGLWVQTLDGNRELVQAGDVSIRTKQK